MYANSLVQFIKYISVNQYYQKCKSLYFYTWNSYINHSCNFHSFSPSVIVLISPSIVALIIVWAPSLIAAALLVAKSPAIVVRLSAPSSIVTWLISPSAVAAVVVWLNTPSTIVVLLFTPTSSVVVLHASIDLSLKGTVTCQIVPCSTWFNFLASPIDISACKIVGLCSSCKCNFTWVFSVNSKIHIKIFLKLRIVMNSHKNHVNSCFNVNIVVQSSLSGIGSFFTNNWVSIQFTNFDLSQWIHELILSGIFKSSFRCFVHMEWVISWFVDGDFEVTTLVLRIFVRFVNVRGVVIDFTNSQGSKFFTVIVPSHKESTILNVRVSNSFFFLCRYILPIGISVWPLPLWFSFSPWVSELDNSMLLALEIESCSI